MSALAVIALVVAAAWLGAVTLLVLLLVRQVALLNIRVERLAEGPTLDGISVGSDVPEPVREALPATASGHSYLLVLSATCGPCRELADDLGAVELNGQRVVALVSGEAATASAIAERLPERVETALDPEATRAVESLDLQTTPFAFELRDGSIVDKTAVRNAAHFGSFLDGQDEFSAASRPRSMEVTHVH